MWHQLSASEMAAEVDGCIRGRTSELLPVHEIVRWIEANRGEVEAYVLAPHSIADRILAERDMADAS